MSEKLVKLLIEEVQKGGGPMLKYNKEIRNLVAMKQRYLAELSRLYGLRSIQVENQVVEGLTNLDMRIFAVETVYRSRGNLTAGIDGVKLQRTNLLDQLDYLTPTNLLKYEPSGIRRVFIPKGKKEMRPLGIPTIQDRIMQTLFVQVIEPTIDVHADLYSFGYRKGRTAHQAIGELTRILNVHPKGELVSKKNFLHTKFVLNLDIEGFFDNVSHEYLLNNYPMPRRYKGLFEKILKSEIHYYDKVESVFFGFPQGSVIGPSLANFTLNGLEELIKPLTVTKYDQEKFLWFRKTLKEEYTVGNSKVRKKLINRVIRFADDFVIITNDKEEAFRLKKQVDNFLKERNLNLNREKSNIIPGVDGAKFDYLGYTFHYVMKPKSSRVTEQRTSSGYLKLRGGLYVYPSNKSIMKFKQKVKAIFSNYNDSVYKMIEQLNPIIRGGGNYFSLGTLRVFSRLDHFIYYRSGRYLRRKYKKVPVKRLISRYYQGVETQTGRLGQFHGTLSKASEYVDKTSGRVNGLLLLCRLNNPVQAQMVRATNKLLKISSYEDETFYEEGCVNVHKLRSTGKKVLGNKGIELYKKQKGRCDVCQKSLGYLLEENLEIHHVRQVKVSKSEKDDINNVNNLKLIHKSCHKSLHVLK